MKLMHSEWQDRVKHWVRTLRDDFYEPLGEIRWEAFRTMDHLSPEEAQLVVQNCSIGIRTANINA